MIMSPPATLDKLGAGGLPNLSGPVARLGQQMQFQVVTQTMVDHESVETIGPAFTAMAAMTPMAAQEVKQRPEGKRTWRYKWLWTTPEVRLLPDSTVIVNGVTYRVRKVHDYSEYGYIKYDGYEDFTAPATQ